MGSFGGCGRGGVVAGGGERVPERGCGRFGHEGIRRIGRDGAGVLFGGAGTLGSITGALFGGAGALFGVLSVLAGLGGAGFEIAYLLRGGGGGQVGIGSVDSGTESGRKGGAQSLIHPGMR